MDETSSKRRRVGREVAGASRGNIEPSTADVSRQASVFMRRPRQSTQLRREQDAVKMHCQNCKTPLKLDSTLENLGPAAINLLVDATATSLSNVPRQVQSSRLLYTQTQKDTFEKASVESTVPSIKRSVGPSRNDGFGKDHRADMSFIMLTESQVVPPNGAHPTENNKSEGNHDGGHALLNGNENMSWRMERAARLFEVLSSRSDIDHPICTECTEMLLEGFEKRLATAVKDQNAYSAFLRNLRADVPSKEELQQAERELDVLKAEEAEAMKELEKVEAEHAALEKSIAELDDEAKRLDAEEEEFWKERNTFMQTLKEFKDERDSINMRYEHDAALLEQLQRTNIYNDTFCVSHDGYFGTINGLRLGRMSGSTVEWSEVNAAWGQACLLLATVADKLNFQFQGYRLNPMGSTSTIDKIELPQRTPGSSAQAAAKVATTTSLALFYSSDLPINIGFLHRHFDSAMVAFLECIRQLGKHVERTTRGTQSGGELGLQLPYEIKKDKINECSIKLSGFGGDESWTKACKFTLTCCKFLLAHASNISGARKGN